MAFDSSRLMEKPGQILSEDRYREVELGVVFRRLTCHRCGFESVYKYRVQQVRRKDEIAAGEDEEIRPDHLSIWRTIPRFAEIPETVKCKRCQEVIGLYTQCIF